MKNMTDCVDPWRVPVIVAQIPDTGLHREIEADRATCDAMAIVAGLRDILSASASLDLTPEKEGRVHVAGRVRARIGRWASIEPIDAASCAVQLTTDSFEWPAMALGSLDAPFTVRSPIEFVDYVRAWGNRFTEAVTSSELVD